jgi:antitoxin CptB
MKTKKQLQWACRRGMLELDLLLQQYLDHDFDTLTSDEQQLFDDLLGEADQDLFSWLFADIKPKTQFVAICEKIKIFRQQH